MPKPVLLVIASVGFQPVEYQNTKQALEAAGILVETASDKIGQAEASDKKTKIQVTKSVTEVVAANYDGIFLIGGPGAWERLNSPAVHRVVQDAAKRGMPYGAICVSPRILAVAGVLKERQATGWNEDGKVLGIFTKNGVIPQLDQSVVRDGLVVTAEGPQAATEFGKKIAEVVTEYRNK